MDDLAAIEEKLKKLHLIRLMEHAFVLLEGGPKHNALISSIKAEDAAEAERSVTFPFTAEESAAIFVAAREILNKRYEALKAEVG